MTIFAIGRKGVVVYPPGVTDGPIPTFATEDEVQTVIRGIRSANERGWFHVIELKLPEELEPVAEEPSGRFEIGYVGDDMSHD